MKYNQDINRCRGVDPRLLGQMLGCNTPVNTLYNRDIPSCCAQKRYENEHAEHENGMSGSTDSPCGCFPSLAMVYSPNQTFSQLYSVEDAIAHGTLFSELYKPWMVGG